MVCLGWRTQQAQGQKGDVERVQPGEAAVEAAANLRGMACETSKVDKVQHGRLTSSLDSRVKGASSFTHVLCIGRYL